jgi:hypothetical protein
VIVAMSFSVSIVINFTHVSSSLIAITLSTTVLDRTQLCWKRGEVGLIPC